MGVYGEGLDFWVGAAFCCPKDYIITMKCHIHDELCRIAPVYDIIMRRFFLYLMPYPWCDGIGWEG